MTSTSQTLTFETRLPRALPAEQSAVLGQYAEVMSRVARHYLAQVQKARKAKLLGQKAPPEISKSDYMAEYGLTGRQYNAVKVMTDGMISSRLENLPNYIAQCEDKIKGLQQRHKRNAAKIKQILATDPDADIAKLKRSLIGFEQRIERLERLKADYKHQRKHKLASICIGSRKLFRKQFNLMENGYANHDEWKADWRAARSAQFFVIGSSDEGGGSQGCTLLPGADGTWILRLRLPEAMVAQHGKYLYLTDVRFDYRPELLEQAVAKHAVRREQAAIYQQLVKLKAIPRGRDKKVITENAFLAPYGQSLSYRFLRDHKGWRVLVSTSAEFKVAKPDFRKGALGVDFNAGFVSIADVNQRGQKLALRDIRYDRLDATSPQNATAMQALAVEIVSMAEAAGKPVVIETLDFRKKKAGLQKKQQGQSAYHQMLSSLSYAAFRHTLRMQCLKRGVALRTVPPAYTSLLGTLKYTRETDQNTHQAAAWVIARRAMKLNERIPAFSRVAVLGRTEVYAAPEDADGNTFGGLAKVQSHFSAWFKQRYGEIRKKAATADLSVSFQDLPV